MGTERRVVIKRNNASPPQVVFDPDPFPAQPGDQIFWFNDDTVAHWPALLNDDDTISDPKTSFMRQQIEPQRSSTSTNPAVDLKYGCCLHLDADKKATERSAIKFPG
jgi:plastocyanin